ncbi:hypothetical protein CPB85DRAFT_1521766 [Mucidula mucida]|nr:hypothetical protein CPB85DRAFT_1521766 [Mucidula mucida]
MTVTTSDGARTSDPTTNSTSPPITCVKIKPASAPTRVERLPGGYVPNRPNNAWLLYRACRGAQDHGRGDQQQSLSKAYGADWKALSADEQKPFYDVYRADDALFRRRFPHYHYEKGARSKWEEQASEYSINVAHDWSPKNDHLFELDENEAVVHTPSVIPVTEDTCDSPSTPTSPSSTTSFLDSPEMSYTDADSPMSTYTDEAFTPVVPFRQDGLLYMSQVVEYSTSEDDRLVPPGLLYQDYNEPATKPELSTHFDLVPGEDLDMISALQFNSLNGYEPGDPAPSEFEYYQPPGIASLWMPQYYHAE